MYGPDVFPDVLSRKHLHWSKYIVFWITRINYLSTYFISNALIYRHKKYWCIWYHRCRRKYDEKRIYTKRQRRRNIDEISRKSPKFLYREMHFWNNILTLIVFWCISRNFLLRLHLTNFNYAHLGTRHWWRLTIIENVGVVIICFYFMFTHFVVNSWHYINWKWQRMRDCIVVGPRKFNKIHNFPVMD